MVKKKQIAEKWVVLDENDQVHHYSNFSDALHHPGGRVRIMTEEFYKTRYEEITGQVGRNKTKS